MVIAASLNAPTCNYVLESITYLITDCRSTYKHIYSLLSRVCNYVSKRVHLNRVEKTRNEGLGMKLFLLSVIIHVPGTVTLHLLSYNVEPLVKHLSEVNDERSERSIGTIQDYTLHAVTVYPFSVGTAGPYSTRQLRLLSLLQS